MMFSIYSKYAKLTTLLALFLFIQVESLTANAHFVKRQARDERGRLIDLNKEASPEPELPTSHDQRSSISHSQIVSSNKHSTSENKSPRYLLPRIYKKIDVPEGLTPEQKKEYRQKVKVERRRETVKKLKITQDPKIRKIVSESDHKRLEKQRIYDSAMWKKVKEGQGTEKERNIIANKKRRNFIYYHSVKKPKVQAQRQKSTSTDHQS